MMGGSHLHETVVVNATCTCTSCEEPITWQAHNNKPVSEVTAWWTAAVFLSLRWWFEVRIWEFGAGASVIRVLCNHHGCRLHITSPLPYRPRCCCRQSNILLLPQQVSLWGKLDDQSHLLHPHSFSFLIHQILAQGTLDAESPER